MRMKGLVLLKLDEEQPAEIVGCSFCSRKFTETGGIGNNKGRKKEKKENCGVVVCWPDKPDARINKTRG